MTLKDFINRFVCKNTLVRLWKPVKGGHQMLYTIDVSLAGGTADVCMDWQLLSGGVWQSKYADNKVIGVTDIVVDTYREAVNIVVEV